VALGSPVDYARGGFVLVYDTWTGKEKWAAVDNRQPAHHQVAYAVAFRPDGARVASASIDGTLKIWNGADGRLLRTLSVVGRRRHRLRMHLTRDGKTGRELKYVGDYPGPSTVAYSPDGRLLAAANVDGSVSVWEPRTGRLLALLHEHGPVVTALAFAPRATAVSAVGDRSLLALGDQGGEVAVHDARTGRSLHAARGHGGAVGGVAFSPDGRRLFSGGADGVVKVWEAETGRDVLTLQAPAGLVTALAVRPRRHAVVARSETVPQPSCLLLTGSYWGNVFLWDAEGQE
jgi:WD40 repeat protein